MCDPVKMNETFTGPVVNMVDKVSISGKFETCSGKWEKVGNEFENPRIVGSGALTLGKFPMGTTAQDRSHFPEEQCSSIATTDRLESPRRGDVR